MASTSRFASARLRRQLRRFAVATAAATLLVAASVLPAQADITDNQSPNWAGAIGRPAALDPATPVDVAYMGFIIPVLDCKHDGYVTIWAGMDSKAILPGQPLPAVSQAGVRGHCLKGKVTWDPWYEAYPEYLQIVDSLPTLHAGMRVDIHVNYRPDIAPDAFVASFLVQEPQPFSPQAFAYREFRSALGASQRDRGECIVERMAYSSGSTSKAVNTIKTWLNGGKYWSLPKFTAQDGSDFTARCATGQERTELEGPICLAGYSSCLLTDMYATWAGALTLKKLVDATAVYPDTVRFHWRDYN